MRILLISDIHGNVVALEAVLKKVQNIDAVWCLGDLVDYGPNPNECIQLLKEQPNLQCVIGNHDAAVIGTISTRNFNPAARSSALWTRKRLSDESHDFIQYLPETIETELGLLVHGSPHDHIMEYLLDVERAARSFRMFNGDFCFVGHSHLPMYFKRRPGGFISEHIIREEDLTTDLEPRMICNPGSVGQPRDRNPKASYAIIDSDAMTITWQRAEYDVEKTKLRMAHHKLPLRHITRLEYGW